MENYNFSFTLESVRDYISYRGGKITNHELVKHFKSALTDPSTRDAARNHFKEIVNTIATITRNDDGEKYLVLKKRYRSDCDTSICSMVAPDLVSLGGGSQYDELEPPPYKPPPPPSEDPNRRYEQPRYYQHSEYAPQVSRLEMRKSPSISRSSSLHDSIVDLPLIAPSKSPYFTGRSGDSPMGSRPNSLYDSPQHSRSTSLPSSQPGSLPSSQPESRFGSVHSLAESSGSRPSSMVFDSPRRDTNSSSRASLTSHDSVFATPPTSPMKAEPPPPVPPRRKSSEKIRLSDNKENEVAGNKRPKSLTESPSMEKQDGVASTLDDSKISVRERMQKFNRMASESALTDVLRPKKRFEKAHPDRDDDDSASVNSLHLDPKVREWCVKCSQGDYQAIAKMAAENPKLVKHRNAANGYTALHWAAKHGNMDLVKLVAGTYGADVNQKTNGGYTALHIAMQYGNEEIYNLLSQVYGADVNVRDWSGKKPRQYQLNKDTTVCVDAFRKIKPRKKHGDKDHGFLRIGSLNVRVKKTTEAFSNFLGVGQTDKLHKNWGSADNIPADEDGRKMPPPKTTGIRKRKSKRNQDFNNRKSTTSQPVSHVSTDPAGHDSDSDTAAGFGTNWVSTA